MAAVSHQSSRPPLSQQPPNGSDSALDHESNTLLPTTIPGNSYPFHNPDTTTRPTSNSNSSPTTAVAASRADPRFDSQQPTQFSGLGTSPSTSTPPPTLLLSDTNKPTNGSSSTSPVHRQQPHLSTSSTSSSVGKPQKQGGIFAFAAAAFDRTSNALAGISEQKLRPRQSASRLSVGLDSGVHFDSGSVDRRFRDRPASTVSQSSSTPLTPPPELRQQSQKQLSRDPPSQPYTETDASHPLPIILPRLDNKMHQTSSRLLRMTDDDRPFTRDFKDLFSTLIVSLLPLSAHRVRLTKVEHTFLSEDAINNLGSLKFSQSNRMPDPKDPSRIVTTTTTTTFSMAKDMARSICQRFVEARFIESADGKYQQSYNMKGSVWQLTAKGICILDRFCSRNGIQQKQVAELIGNSIAQLVILERDGQTDKLVHDRGTIEVIFRRFIGINGFNIKSSVSSADSESLSDYRDGLTGVKMAAERKVNGKTHKDTFTGKATTDWLMDCCTTVDRRETFEMASLFVEFDLMEPLAMDRTYMAQYPGSALFQPTKTAIYQITNKGRDLINGSLSRGRASESEGLQTTKGTARDSNTQRLDRILNDPALRLLFRENLRETHCEENLSFYLDVDDFVRGCRQATRLAQKNPNSTSMDGIKEIMAQAYGIYNAFLAPGSPCELNIDHQLRSNLATRMTKAVGQDVAMIDTLHEVTSLFEDAQNAVFKLMASDSVPKFLRSPKYEQTLKNYDFDSVVSSRVPERSQSRSNRK